MFGFEKPKMEKLKTLPSYEELGAALPEELWAEWVQLGKALQTIEMQKEKGSEGNIDDADLSDDERKVFDRYAELQAMALENLGKKSA